MSLARSLPDRWRKFVHEALKFGLVGGINTVINYAVFNALALTVFRDGQLKATVVATVVAAFTSYLMNRHWTYRDRPKSAMRREYLLFFVFNGIGLAIELGMLAMVKYGFGINSLLAINVGKTFGLVLGTVFRFWAYRTFVFHHAPVAADGHIEHHLTAELDPVAELAEAVTDMAEHDAARYGSTGGARPDRPYAPTGAPALDQQVVPLEAARFADPVDAELQAGIDSELHVSDRRPGR